MVRRLDYFARLKSQEIFRAGQGYSTFSKVRCLYRARPSASPHPGCGGPSPKPSPIPTAPRPRGSHTLRTASARCPRGTPKNISGGAPARRPVRAIGGRGYRGKRPSSSPLSNSPAPVSLAHPSDRDAGLCCSTGWCESRGSPGATPKARAGLPRVPKCGRPILPVSMPETVVGLTLASRASLAWVHIRKRRMFSKPSPMLGMFAPHL